ncbi:hypothetical protein ACOMHN_005433 [Nucella lapillus]
MAQSVERLLLVKCCNLSQPDPRARLASGPGWLPAGGGAETTGLSHTVSPASGRGWLPAGGGAGTTVLSHTVSPAIARHGGYFTGHVGP